MDQYIYINGEEFKSYDETYYISKSGKIYSKSSNKLLSQCNGGKNGNYYQVNIHGKTRLVHRLVYETWIGKIDPGFQINHKDDNKHNNNIDNLYMGTIKENIDDMFRNNLAKVVTKTVVVYDKLYMRKLIFPSIKSFNNYIGYAYGVSLNYIKNVEWVKNRFIFYDKECVETNYIDYNDSFDYLIDPIIYD